MSSTAFDIRVLVERDNGLPVSNDAEGTIGQIQFSRVIPAGDKENGSLPEAIVADVATFEVGADLTSEASVRGVAKGTELTFSLLRTNGLPAFSSTKTVENDKPVIFTIGPDELAALTAPSPQPAAGTPPAERRAQLVPNGAPVAFDRCHIQVAPVATGNGRWKSTGLAALLNSETPARGAVELSVAAPVPPLDWRPVHLEIDGRFTAVLPDPAADGWAWRLTGLREVLGFVPDVLGRPNRDLISLPLPPAFAGPAGAIDCEACARPTPVSATEEELANNPGVYSEDPGAYCRPFTNPERVLGERAFNVIMRVEQPAISVGSSIKVHGPMILDFDRAPLATGLAVARTRHTLANEIVADHSDMVLFAERGAEVRDTKLPDAYLDVLDRLPRGRAELNANNPIQWEGDSSRYQASTVTRGHIVEYRVRWRSNGYSLGTVASTLTLAPRQVKRIQKVEWNRSERARRDETTGFSERVADEVTRDRTYDDQVDASLSEWARGRSDSSATSAAAGVGFAAVGFVIGGGGVHSTGHSSSSQEGGRRVSASEEQRLRDSIKRFADASRRFESTVVTEVSQDESVTGTVEVVRNPNYAHSLTVIYHQILRHLRVDTEVAGVRECLFVPFAMRPFTLERAYRWRETIRQALRQSKLAPAMEHVKDVLSGFANSDVPAGRRSDLPVRYINGSIFLRLGIERPADGDGGIFVDMNWSRLAPFLSTPPRGIFSRLGGMLEHLRDQIFQSEFAPAAAAKWVDRLELEADGVPLHADFTLATRYQFNGTVRVDFTASIPDSQLVTRETLRKIVVRASKPLSKGSSAAVTRLTLNYQTDNFERSVAMSAGVADLISPETGDPDQGAELSSIPNSWERQNLRADITRSVNALVDHLNEHIEFYNKAVLWATDRDRLLIMLDGFFVPRTNGVSIASVVERDPVAIVGNCLVYRVAAGSFLGLDDIKTPQALANYYIDNQPPRSPMLVSLPTDGLYAQTIMDECAALEEHYGNTDWVLNQEEPTLGDLPAELLNSRQAATVNVTPTPLPATIINLQNAPDAPDPTGLGGVLGAVSSANAFRDMAGLSGTQANVRAAMDAAASLATNFGNQAAALKMADIASKARATASADQQLATIRKAKDLGLVSDEQASAQANEVLRSLHSATASTAPHENSAFNRALNTAGQTPGSIMEAETQDGKVRVEVGKGSDVGGASANDEAENVVAPEPDATMTGDPFWSDDHGRELGADPNFSVDDSTLLAFNENEHSDLGQSVQWMVNHWARKGLIDGGLLIDTKARLMPSKLSSPVDDWKIVPPDLSSPNAPYDSADSYSHWHYITPNPLYSNPASKTRWTEASLKAAIKQGKAAALSIGQIVMMAGDFLSTVDELISPQTQPRWTSGNSVHAMAGFDQKDPLAYLLLDVKSYPPKGVPSDQLAALNKLQRGRDERAKVAQEIANGDYSRLEAYVKFLRAARGTTPFTEIHLLAHSMFSATPPDFGVTYFKGRAPWLPASAADTLQAAVNPQEFLKALNGFDELFWKTVVTNGWYGELALKNDPHFAPGNWQRFSTEHRMALEAVQSHLTGAAPAGATAPIPATAIARTAFAMHFLTDTFSSGHMRVPRSVLGPNGGLAAKVMHDLDGRYGLLVQNGFGERWRAFGDGSLDPGTPPRQANQAKILKQINEKPGDANINTDPEANKDHVIAAVGAAFKQLHYEAQRHKTDPAAAGLKPVLDATVVGNGLAGDSMAPSSPGDGAFADWLVADIPAKIAFMEKHRPLPLPVGVKVTQNHPPLYDPNGGVPGLAYSWHDNKLQANMNRVLHLRWHGSNVEYDFSDMFHFGRIIEGLGGWVAGGETQVQQLPAKLKEE